MTDQPSFRAVPFAPLDIAIDRRPDGAMVLESRLPLVLRRPSLPAYLAYHAQERPERNWLGQRDPADGPWSYITFGEAKRQVDGLTRALHDLVIGPGQSLMILSANSIEHAVISLAAMQVGIPVAPVSAAYSIMSQDHAKLREIAATARPGVVFVQDGAQFGPAANAVSGGTIPVIAARNVQPGQLALGDLLASASNDHLETCDDIDANSTAKIMFTSGSTGSPKGVPLTHEAFVIAAESNLTVTGALAEGSKVRVDWAPWSHVFGATTLSLSIVEGGTLHIDAGRPMPKLFDETLRNLADVQPDLIMTVPAAISMLVDALEKDDRLAARVLERLTALGYGGASLPEDVVRRFEALAIQHTGHRISISCGYGTTETGPGGGFVYWLTDQTGTLGLPHPGFAMKLVPIDADRFEVRISSRAVMRGYIGRDDLNATIFDDEGFYRTGDCVTLGDGADPLSGLVFAGRLNEEFKLQSGTFVRVGAVRSALLEATAPLLRDLVVCGENQACLGILAWLHPDAVGRAKGDAPAVIDAVRDRIAAYNVANPGNASAIRTLRILTTPPSLDLGEVTDKGSLNQRAVQRVRPDDVAALFQAGPPSGTFLIPPS
jgi:feruloyl-CoA synthase